jgi:two-component system, cell cycle sensor histidine kinase and response regulator CckA
VGDSSTTESDHGTHPYALLATAPVTVPGDAKVVSRFKLAAVVASAACIGLGVLVLAGWLFDMPVLKSVHPSFATMKANTAACFLLVGSALFLRNRGRHMLVARALAAVVLLIAALTLLEYATGWSLGIDEALFRDDARRPNQPPGRMSYATAINFLLLGSALAFFDLRFRRGRLAPWLALLAALVSLLSLIGYLYGVPSLYAIVPFNSIALHTTLAFLAASIGVLFARPDEGPMRFVSSDSPAGVMSRRLLPAALLIPAIIGWLRLRGELAGFYDARFGLAMFASANIVIFSVLVWWSSGGLFLADSARRVAEAALAEREEDLRITLHSIGDGVIATNAAGRVTRMNPVAERLTGWSIGDANGRSLDEVFRILNEETRRTVESPADRVLREGGVVGLANHTVLVGRDGVERMIADSGAPIRDAGGNLRGVVLVFRDQTNERGADRALLESEARKAAVMEAALDCIVVMDHEGRIVELNPAAEKTFGYARADALGKPLVDLLVPPALRSQHKAGLERYLKTGEGPIIGKRIEISAMRSTGEEFPAEVAVVRINTEGPPTFTGYIRDITERKRASEALRASEARFRRLIESGIVGIVLADTSGKLHEANDAFLQLIGYTREDLEAGRIHGSKLTPPEWRDAQEIARQELLAHGVTRPWEKEFYRKDGSRVPVLIAVTMLDQPNVLNVVVDLTEQKRAQAAIRKLEAQREADARFRGLLEAAPDAMVIVDRAGDVVFVNAQAERLFGYAQEELLGKSVDRLVPDRFRGAHAKHRGAYSDDPKTRAMGSGLDLFACRKDGSEFPVEISLSPLETKEGVLISSAIRDITERRRVEEELRRARDAAEISSRELEAFSYSVAHDLRAPLRGINGYSAALIEDLGDKVEGEAKDYLLRISAGAARMGQLIDALLGLSRVSRRQIDRSAVDLTAMARAVMSQLREGDPARHVELLVTDGMAADADPQLLRVLLENLIGNSWKFTAKREPARIEVGQEARGDALVFFVRDSGAGFDMQFADKLFTPFQRLHAESEFGGTGIGLATVQRIVRRHGGRIWAEGAVGRGATFYFTLDTKQQGGH